MPPDNLYSKTYAQLLIELLRDKDNGLGQFFKYVVYGPMKDPSESYLPAIVVQNNTSRIIQNTTATDEIQKNLTIKLIIRAADELGKKIDEMPGAKSLELWAEGISPDTGEYDPRSVIGILRRNFTLGANAVDQQVDIDYLPPDLTDGRTVQAHITVTITGIKVVTGRS